MTITILDANHPLSDTYYAIEHPSHYMVELITHSDLRYDSETTAVDGLGLNERIIEASAGCAANGLAINDVYDEYANTTGSDVEDGGIWDSRGYWVDDDGKVEFLNWMARQ